LDLWPQKRYLLFDFALTLFQMNTSTLLYSLVYTIFRALCLPLHLITLFFEYLIGTLKARRRDPHHVLITGAASGMGQALALYYAKKHAALSLIDLNLVGLEETKALSLTLGSPYCEVAKVDVRDAAAMKVFIEERDKEIKEGGGGPIDLVLAVAGLIESRVAGGRALDDLELGARTLIEVNILGLVNTVLPAIRLMRKRSRGQIGVLSSLAEKDHFSSLYPAYAASKSFVTSWALGLRAHLQGSGVTINVFAPGAVRTPLLAPVKGLDPHYDLSSRGPQWIVHSPIIELSAENAAKAWADGLQRDEALTRPHHLYSLLCHDLCLCFPREAHDLLARNGLHMLWGWRPKLHPQHSWTIEQTVGAGKS
jgi:NAD(P)-dependent dehydrogenase (short-subunit alcohol dehydrogenase family)